MKGKFRYCKQTTESRAQPHLHFSETN